MALKEVFFVGFGLHKWYTNCSTSWAAVIIWVVLSAIISVMGIYLLVPYLNRVFGQMEKDEYIEQNIWPGALDINKEFITDNTANLIGIIFLSSAALIALI